MLNGQMVQVELQGIRMTILYRRIGWFNGEVQRLGDKLRTKTARNPNFPRLIILEGFFTKKEAIKAIGSGKPFEIKQVTGFNSPDLPFQPRFV